MKRVLITGATGFIGGRVAEVLTEQGIEVTALVRSWATASRLARLPVRMVGGDVLDAESVRRAVDGCDVVVHCAVDFRAHGRAHRRASRVGTRNVMQAALEAGVSRVVHLSSTAVFGLRPAAGRTLTEATPVRRVGDAYCDGKIEAERVALEYHRVHGLPVTVLRPTIVYGPFGWYSAAVARAAREGRLVLVDGAPGVCNCLYVDNLVQAILLAATRPQAVGEIFHISDAKPVTWREYLERHARALGDSILPLPEMTRAELRAARNRLRRFALRQLARSAVGNPLRVLRDPAIRQGLFSIPGVQWASDATKSAIRLLPGGAGNRIMAAIERAKAGQVVSGAGRADVRAYLSPAEERSFAAYANVTFGIDKARSLLGYEPAVSFDEGMELTTAWLRWAGI